MAGEGVNRLPSWDQDLHSSDSFSPVELQGIATSLRTIDENMLVDEFARLFEFLHSINNPQTSGGGPFSHSTPQRLFHEQWYPPEEIPNTANIYQDSSADVSNNAFASTIGFTHGGNIHQTAGGESSMGPTPHTPFPELDLSHEEYRYNNKIPSAVSGGLPCYTSATSSNFPKNGTGLAFMDSSSFSQSSSESHSRQNSTSDLCDPSGQLQSFSSFSPASDYGFQPEACVSPSEFFPYGSKPQTSESGNPTSMAPRTFSSTSPDSSEELQSSGSSPPAFINSLQPNVIQFGSDFLQSNVSSRGFGNENSYSAFRPQDQMVPYALSASHSNAAPSGQNSQIDNDEFYNSRPFHKGQILPWRPNYFHTNSLHSGHGWQTMSNIPSAPTPVPQDHLFGHPLHCIFSGNDFPSLIRAAATWPSASFLDISIKNAVSTSKSLIEALPVTLPHQPFPPLTQSF